MFSKNKNNWEDEKFINELNHEYDAWKKGNAKAYTLSEVDLFIEGLRQNLDAHYIGSKNAKTKN